jgi:hypothetical protein
MMIIVTSYTINMHCDPRRLRKALQTMRYHLATEISNLLPLQSQINDTEWSIRQIHYGTGKRFVERSVCGSKSCETSRYAKGFFESASERNADVFRSMVVVN